MTQLHAGGKFDQNSYKVSGGLHGVGVSVVNALSEWLELRIWRDGKEHTMRFADGEPEAPLEVVGDAGDETGTEVTFLPSTETFSMTEFDFDTLEHRLRELAFLNSGVRDRADRRPQRRAQGSRTCTTKAASRPSCAISTAPSTPLHRPRRSSCRRARRHHRRSVAMQWNDSYHENVLCFTNNIPQRDGGTHLAGFRARADPHRSTATPPKAASPRRRRSR